MVLRSSSSPYLSQSLEQCNYVAVVTRVEEELELTGSWKVIEVRLNFLVVRGWV